MTKLWIYLRDRVYYNTLRPAFLWPFRTAYFTWHWYMVLRPALRADQAAAGGWGKPDDAYYTAEFGAEWWGCDLAADAAATARRDWTRGPALTPDDWVVG